MPIARGGDGHHARRLVALGASEPNLRPGKSDPQLQQLLLNGRVLIHLLVIGEIACGNLRNRAAILSLLGELPPVALASDEEVLAAMEAHRLWGKGIGWIDAHLLASALLSKCALWTHDRRLRAAAAQLKLHWPSTPGR